MSTIHIIAFSVVTGIETFIICVGNAFAIFVFWTQYTGSRRRSSYLLINLAVTDFFVGVSGLPSLIIDYIPSYLRNKKSEDSFAEFFPAHYLSCFQPLLLFLSLPFQWNALSPSCIHSPIEQQAIRFTSTALLLSGRLGYLKLLSILCPPLGYGNQTIRLLY